MKNTCQTFAILLFSFAILGGCVSSGDKGDSHKKNHKNQKIVSCIDAGGVWDAQYQYCNNPKEATKREQSTWQSTVDDKIKNKKK